MYFLNPFRLRCYVKIEIYITIEEAEVSCTQVPGHVKSSSRMAVRKPVSRRLLWTWSLVVKVKRCLLPVHVTMARP